MTSDVTSGSILSAGQRVLLWGSGSQAFLYSKYVDDVGARYAIFDPYAACRPIWSKDAPFSSQPQDLGRLIDQSDVFLVAVGGEHGFARHSIFERLTATGLVPVSIVDESANIKSTCDIGLGTAVMQAVVVNHETRIGPATIINTGATIDHECQIGCGVHIMGAAAIAGRVRVEDFAVVGTNATVLPDLVIGRGAYIGAGAVVIRDVAPLEVVAGSPARTINQRQLKNDPKLPSIF